VVPIHVALAGVRDRLAVVDAVRDAVSVPIRQGGDLTRTREEAGDE